MDKVRCLLIQSGFPNTFWVEATCTAAYLINRSPSRAIEKKDTYRDVVGTSKLYRLDDESSKIVTSRNVAFNESVMYKDTIKDYGAGDKSVEKYRLRWNYSVRDRELRTRTKPLRLRDESNMDAYAFVAPEEEDTHEQLTYQEAVACEDSSN
ncbi:hypothetical protein Tco_1338134 [Tanacetum coccineum]